MRTTRLAVIALAALALVAAVPAPARAGDRDFDAVVEHLQREYGARKRDSLPFFARLAVKVAKPAGVKSVKITTLDGLTGAGGGDRLDALLRDRLDGSWRPIVRIYSKRDREQTFVYVRPAKKDVELLVVAVDGGEATVVKAKVDPRRVEDWVGDMTASRR